LVVAPPVAVVVFFLVVVAAACSLAASTALGKNFFTTVVPVDVPDEAEVLLALETVRGASETAVVAAPRFGAAVLAEGFLAVGLTVFALEPAMFARIWEEAAAAAAALIGETGLRGEVGRDKWPLYGEPKGGRIGD
jgi:hypothetical protein